ncbi:MAG: BamA/TamA family outer membrane protein [candidate division WOR-3 bacterium]
MSSAAAVALIAGALAGNNGHPDRVVSRIEVVGLPGRRLAPQLAVGETASSERLTQAGQKLREELAERGFLWAQVEWDTVGGPGGVKVTYRVTAGPRARLAGWNFTGNKSIASLLLARSLPRRGTVLSRGVLSSALEEILSLYDRNGFPFVEVSAPAVRDSGGWVSPTLLVNEGPKVRVDFLEFSGSGSLKPTLLLRAAGFRPGTGYSTGILQSWKRNLEKTGWAQVESEELVTSDGRFGVRFWLTERHTTLISGALGYLPEDERFTGMVRLRFLNLLGTGRKFEAAWHSVLTRTVYELSYTEPWVFGSRLSGAGSIRQTVVDTSYSQTNITLSGVVGTRGAELGVETGYERLAGLVNCRTVWAGTGFGLDTRDRPLNPGKGIILEVKTRVGERLSGDSSSVGVGRAELELELFQTAGRLVLANRIAGRIVSAQVELTEPELYRLGGAQSVRGYREGSFVSSRVVWLNSELWLRFGQRARIYPFFDLGLYQSLPDRQWHWAPGYGIGGRWQTGPGLFGLDYGVAFQESPLRGKVHLSYEGGF